MNYFNVGKIVNTQGLQGEMRVLSVTDFAEERFKKGSELALFDEKDQFVQTVTIASHRKHKNFDIIKFKDMYHINAIEKYKGYSLKVAEEDFENLSIEAYAPVFIFCQAYREKEYRESEYWTSNTKLILGGNHHYLQWSESEKIATSIRELSE